MYSLALLAALALVWLAMRYLDRRPFSDTGWRWNARSLPALGLGIAATVALVVPVAVAVQATGVLRPTRRSSPCTSRPPSSPSAI